MSEKLPVRLYKYRAFNTQALDMIVSDNLYYADPSRFNDPLDSRPSLAAGLDEDALEETLMTLVEQRCTEEMRDSAQPMRICKTPRCKPSCNRPKRYRRRGQPGGFLQGADNTVPGR